MESLGVSGRRMPDAGSPGTMMSPPQMAHRPNAPAMPAGTHIGAPHAAQSLLATAGILENHLNQPGKAMQIYQSVRTQFPNSLAADEADRQLARLQAAGVRPD